MKNISYLRKQREKKDITLFIVDILLCSLRNKKEKK